MSDAVIYVDRFTIRDGGLEDFRRYAADMAAFVEANEPDVISYGYYVNPAESSGTALFVFAGPEALDRHLAVAGSRFQEGAALLRESEIQLFGTPSQQAAAPRPFR